MTQATRGDATREALIRAAIDVFGRDGFDATRTRTIAETAKVNQALIGYHFRNKEGLYLAVFADIVEQIRARIGPVLAEIEAALDGDLPPGREDGLALLFRMTDAFILLMAGTESNPWAQLVVREQQSPTAAFALLHDGLMRPVSRGLIRLVQHIDPVAQAGDPRLVVATIMGQMLVFRVARAAVLRIIDQPAIGPDEIVAIQGQLRRNLTAMLVPAGDRS
ncbi:CerR family C-terminal domain-containing protein [Tistrella mobilis]|uniref:CerR family C-terminal domain-containing protein n=1 Tax=Tistrella mobilis TaxID=171437 RepID=UPI003559364E